MNIQNHHDTRIIIVGAGFGGIKLAQELVEHDFHGTITLISPDTHFLYYPSLHKIISDHKNPVCRIPLKDILPYKNVEIIHESVTAVDPVLHTVQTSSGTLITGNILVLSVGSETEYFNIPGLPEMSFGFKSYADATRLKNHIIDLFDKHATTDKSESLVGLHISVVGAGPSGVDLVGELAAWTKKLARTFKVSPSLLTLDLIEGGDRVLGMMPEPVSRHATAHLNMLGVNILLNRAVAREGSWTVEMDDMKLGTKTVVWTAGVRAHKMLSQIPGFDTTSRKGRVAVDEYLRPVAVDTRESFENVYVIGDSADTPYSGLAQTALYDGDYIARSIMKQLRNRIVAKYVPERVAYCIGIGPHYSLFVWGNIRIYGFVAHIMRTLIDISFFLSILPFYKVWRLYMNQGEK